MKLTTLKPRLAAPLERLNTIKPGSWRDEKQTSTQRGYGYKWQKARAAYLMKHPFCVYCLRDAGIPISDDAVAVGMACLAKGIGLPMATVVDHSVPHRGD
ncbi:MAG: HNH endonuclease, partial [Janthinobacterium sp.]